MSTFLRVNWTQTDLSPVWARAAVAGGMWMKLSLSLSCGVWFRGWVWQEAAAFKRCCSQVKVLAGRRFEFSMSLVSSLLPITVQCPPLSLVFTCMAHTHTHTHTLLSLSLYLSFFFSLSLSHTHFAHTCAHTHSRIVFLLFNILQGYYQACLVQCTPISGVTKFFLMSSVISICDFFLSLCVVWRMILLL